MDTQSLLLLVVKKLCEKQIHFISSTFWTERIGPTAAIKTLEIMEREKSWKKITNIGLEIKNRWKEIAERYQLKITFSGLSALPSFNIEGEKSVCFLQNFNNPRNAVRRLLSGKQCLCIY